MILAVRYGAVLTPENLSGADMTVAAFSALDGSTEPRTVADGDVVMAVNISPSGKTTAQVWIAVDGSDWLLAGTQPVAGDMVVGLAPVDDLAYQSGSLVVITADGSFVPANFGLMLALTGHL
jgi:hypothetical protein